jgi:hypothetical protein
MLVRFKKTYAGPHGNFDEGSIHELTDEEFIESLQDRGEIEEIDPSEVEKGKRGKISLKKQATRGKGKSRSKREVKPLDPDPEFDEEVETEPEDETESE